MALLHIQDASGRQWQYELSPQATCTIGRAPDNCVTLNDPMASRHHAHIKYQEGRFVIIDGVVVNEEVKRSINRVMLNGKPQTEHDLADGDLVTIGRSQLRFEEAHKEGASGLNYDDLRLGRTQVAIGAHDVINKALNASAFATTSGERALTTLQHKANILALLYEMGQTLGSVFDLETIFDKATDIIFRVTPADRVVALLGDAPVGADDCAKLKPAGTRTRLQQSDDSAGSIAISRTILNKVLGERVALLSQDAAADSQFAHAKSIVSQGVRSTICAPLVTESGVHGVIYADRLDPTAVFTRDDLEFICALASQTAVAVESARAHARLAREEVARANYSRFLPEYVVRQMLESPESFKLGGTNQTVTVLFADVRGFTRLSEHAPPERVVQLLNRYFTAMTEIIFAHGGTLDKFIGDGLMALFGAPTATPRDAANAITAAVAMQRQMESLNAELRADGLIEIGVGVGLHTGVATVGYIGSERRSEYTAIGDTVNLASRLESRALGGQILVSTAAADAALTHAQFTLRRQPPVTVKNRAQPVEIFEVDWRGPSA
jgi:adenylate cyclase